MKSRACRSAAATFGCHKSTMKTTRGPSSAEPGVGVREERFSSSSPRARTHAELEPIQLVFRRRSEDVSGQEYDHGFLRF